jgi:hypothetical protein
MSYVPIRSGFTGPSSKIGGSSDYHQDLKLLQSLPIAERVKMLDAIAKQNQSIGREIEFSNAAVSGKRWNLNANLTDKINLLEKAAAAHGHSVHPGWQSFDYYTPFKGKSRASKGTVEDASIYIPALPGGKVTRGSGGGYGYFSQSLDPKGRVIAKVGHGNIDRPEVGDVSLLASEPPVALLPGAGTSATQAPAKDTRTQDILEAFMYGTEYKQPEKEKTLAETLKGELLSGALASALAPKKSFLSSFVNQQPYLMGQAASTSDYLSGYSL